MSQNDFIIANASGATVRADINSALQALVTLSSGASAPSTTYPGQYWWDTTNSLVKIRNGANTAWVTVASWDGTTWTPTNSTPADGSVTTAKLANDAVTFAKFQNIATARILGRTTAGTGDVEEISAGAGLSLSGGSVALANTAVSPGSYTNASITVDQQGRLTQASSGSGTSKAVLSFAAAVMTGTGSTTKFYGVGHLSTSETEVYFVAPFAFNAKNMRVIASAAISAGSQTLTFRSGGIDTALSVALSGGASSGSDLVDTVAVTAGSLISLKVATTSGSTSAFIQTIIEIDPT